MHFITQSESFSGSTGGPSLKIAGWLEPTFVNVQTLDPGMIRLRYWWCQSEYFQNGIVSALFPAYFSSFFKNVKMKQLKWLGPGLSGFEKRNMVRRSSAECSSHITIYKHICHWLSKKSSVSNVSSVFCGAVTISDGIVDGKNCLKTRKSYECFCLNH